MHRRQKARCRLFVEEERQRLAAALEGAIELGVGLRKRAGGKVGTAEVEVPDPRVEQGVGLGEHLDGGSRVVLRERDDPLENLAVGLRLHLQLADQVRGDGCRLRDCAALREDAPGQEPHLHAAGVGQRLVGGGNGFAAAAARQLRIGERHQLDRRAIRVLRREVGLRAGREQRRGIGEPALIERDVGQT